jgi:hypothetical protein
VDYSPPHKRRVMRGDWNNDPFYVALCTLNPRYADADVALWLSGACGFLLLAGDIMDRLVAGEATEGELDEEFRDEVAPLMDRLLGTVPDGISFYQFVLKDALLAQVKAFCPLH